MVERARWWLFFNETGAFPLESAHYISFEEKTDDFEHTSPAIGSFG